MLTHLSSIIDRDKNKDILLTNGGYLGNLGASYYDPRWKLTYERVTNGYNSRYRPVNNTVMDSSFVNTLQTVVTDDATGYVKLFEVTLPPGCMGHGDTIQLQFSATGDFTNATFQVENLGQPTAINSEVGGKVYRDASGVSPITNTLTYTQVGGYIITCTGSSFNNFYSPTQRLLNGLDSIKATISARYKVLGTGSKSMTFATPVVTLKPNQIANANLDMANYRKPDVTPYASASFFNNKLDATATYGDLATNPMSRLLRDEWAGLAVKSGDKTNFKYLGTASNKSGIPVYYLTDDDPIEIVKVTKERRYNTINCLDWVAGGEMPLRVPSGLIEAGQSNDKIMIFISPDKCIAYEVAIYSYDTVKKQHTFGHLYTVDLYGYGYSERWWTRYSMTNITSMLSNYAYGFQFNYRGSGLAIMGGLIRKEEMDAGVIPHMITFQVDAKLMKASQVYIRAFTANSFVVTPTSSFVTEMDYTSLFTAGTKVQHTGTDAILATYTCTGVNSWDAGTNRTTIGITETVANVSINGKLITGTSAATRFDSQLVWPCSVVDGVHDDNSYGYAGLIPMGQVFAIPKSVDIGTLGLTPAGLILAKAMQDYGTIVSDITANTFLMAQCSFDVPSTYYDGLNADKALLANQLVPVTNWGYALAQASETSDTTVKPLPPIYMAVEIA